MLHTEEILNMFSALTSMNYKEDYLLKFDSFKQISYRGCGYRALCSVSSLSVTTADTNCRSYDRQEGNCSETANFCQLVKDIL